MTPVDPNMRPEQEPFRKVVENHNGAKLFGSTHNGYIGMFPLYAQPGDVIAVLFGGAWPFVLRKVPNTVNIYQLVRQCYVHGIMEGELDLSKYKAEILWLGGGHEVDEDQARREKQHSTIS